VAGKGKFAENFLGAVFQSSVQRSRKLGLSQSLSPVTLLAQTQPLPPLAVFT
jgi:hypothetical protein